MGITLDIPQAELMVCSAASTSGWRAHLGPDFDTVSGMWVPGVNRLHINLSEIKAVINAFHF